MISIAPICPHCREEKTYTFYGWQCLNRRCVMKRIATDEFKAVELPRDGNLYSVKQDQLDSDWEADDE